MPTSQPKHSFTHSSVTYVAIGLALFIFSLTLPTPAAAQTPVKKFSRGLAGMITGILELPGNMIEQSQKRGPATGIPLGLGLGLAMVIARELTGVYEFLTFPIPVPDGYRPVLHPDYPWDYFKNV